MEPMIESEYVRSITLRMTHILVLLETGLSKQDFDKFRKPVLDAFNDLKREYKKRHEKSN